MLSIVMLIIDIYYLIWISTVHSDYPSDMQDEVSAFLKGAANNLRRYLLLHLNANNYGTSAPPPPDSRIEMAGNTSNPSEKYSPRADYP